MFRITALRKIVNSIYSFPSMSLTKDLAIRSILYSMVGAAGLATT